MSLFRSNMGRQYPSLMPSVFVGTAATSPVQFRNLDAMWTKLGDLLSNRTPAIDVTDAKQSGPSTTHRGSTSTSQHASATPSPSSVVPPSAPHSQPHRSKHNPRPWLPTSMASTGEVMFTQTPDAFTSRFPSWPFATEIWPEVYQVTTAINKADPPLSGLIALTLISERMSSAAVKTTV